MKLPSMPSRATAGLGALTLRLMLLAARLLLILFIAREMTPAEVGQYGLVAAAVAIGMYIVGAEFHRYSTREIVLIQGAAGRGQVLRDQGVLYLAIYVPSLPVLIWIYGGRFFAHGFVLFFVLILVGEHLTTEASRVTVALGHPVTASFLLLVEGALWVFTLVLAHALFGLRVTIDVLLIAWSAGAAASLVLAAAILRRYVDWRGAVRTPVDRRWILRGLAVSLPFWLAASLFMAMTHANRFLLHHWANDMSVGVYTFYWTLANLVPVAVDTSIGLVALPALLRAAQLRQWDAYHETLRYLTIGTIVVTAAAGISVLLASDLIVHLLGRPLYAAQRAVGAVLLAAACLTAISGVPNYRIYACRKDLLQPVPVVLALLVVVGSAVLLIPPLGSMGAALSALTAAASLLAARQALALRHCRPLEAAG